MISLSQSIRANALAETERRFQKAIHCFAASIESLQRHAVEVSVEEAGKHRANLGAILRRIEAEPSCSALDQGACDLEKEVAGYYAKVSSFHEASRRDAQEIVSLLREATGTMMVQNRQYDEEFESFAAQLEKTAGNEDLGQIRRLLTEQVQELRTCVQSMRRDGASAMQPLQNELKAIEGRLLEAERLASVDPLTNLYNRRGGEQRALEKRKASIPFCLLIADLNRFKSVNDRYGHHCGDQILALVAKRLEVLVRPGDIVCRWGGDEFLVIMECQPSDALQRSRQIAEQLRGRYTVLVQGRKVDVEVSASVGISTCKESESVQSAFERADAMLYHVKQA